MEENKKTLQLYDNLTVEINEQLLDDVDYISDLSDAVNKNDMEAVIGMYMAVIGGDEIYKKIRARIEAECGYFSSKELMKVIDKIDGAFPKAGNRASRRSWKPSAR